MKKLFLIIALLLSGSLFASTAYFWPAYTGNYSEVKWRTSTGTAVGSSGPPTTNDIVHFDSNSSGTCTINAAAACSSLIMTGSNATLTVSGTRTLTFSGSNATLGGTITGTTFTLTSTIAGSPTITFHGSSPWPGPMTFNCNGGPGVVTLLNTTAGTDCIVTGLVTASQSIQLAATTTERLVCNGGFTYTAAVAPGTPAAPIVLGGGTLTGTGSGTNLTTDIVIAGTVALGTNVYYKTCNLTYTSGTFSGSYSLNISGNCGFTCFNGANYMSIPNINIVLGAGLTATITNGSKLWVAGTLQAYSSGSSCTMSGAYDVSCATLNLGTGSYAQTLTLVHGQTLFVTSSLICQSIQGNGGAAVTITSDAASAANINYSGTPASCNVSDILFTWITATGNPIFDFNAGTLSNTSNIFSITAANCVAKQGF